MRVVFQDGIIYASYTDEEVDNIGKHKHALIEMTPQELRICLLYTSPSPRDS